MGSRRVREETGVISESCVGGVVILGIIEGVVEDVNECIGFEVFFDVAGGGADGLEEVASLAVSPSMMVIGIRLLRGVS